MKSPEEYIKEFENKAILEIPLYVICMMWAKENHIRIPQVKDLYGNFSPQFLNLYEDYMNCTFVATAEVTKEWLDYLRNKYNG